MHELNRVIKHAMEMPYFKTEKAYPMLGAGSSVGGSGWLQALHRPLLSIAAVVCLRGLSASEVGFDFVPLTYYESGLPCGVLPDPSQLGC